MPEILSVEVEIEEIVAEFEELQEQMDALLEWCHELLESDKLREEDEAAVRHIIQSL